MSIRRKKFVGTILLMCMLFIVTCHQAYAADKATLDDLAGKTAGVLTGTPQEDIVNNNIEDAKILNFNSFTDMALALQEKKIDYYINSTIAYRIMHTSYPDFGYVDTVVHQFDIGAIFPKTEAGEALCAQFNTYIQEISDNGTLDDLKEYWLYPNDWENIDIPSDGENGILTMGASSAMKPFVMVLNNDYAGFDVAVVAGFCKEYGYGLKIEDADFASILSGIAAGKYDLGAGQVSWTEERAKSVLYSDFYCQQDMVPIVRLSDYPNAATYSEDDTSESSAEESSVTENASDSTGKETESSSAAGSSLVNSFKRTLIEEDRWKMILSGLGVTLIITIFGFLLANVLGALFCIMTLSENQFWNVLADVYSRIMQGTPIVIILMILYYIVFGHVQLSGIAVAIIGFGIVFGAYLAQLFAGAVSGVEKGQREAALAVGFTEMQAFRKVVFPQALRAMLPGYFSQLISLMKGTAIVGYIAIADLTRTGDIIRSSTFEPFFPLIVVAVIYFVIAALLLSLLKMIQKKLAPKRSTKAEHDGGEKR